MPLQPPIVFALFVAVLLALVPGYLLWLRVARSSRTSPGVLPSPSSPVRSRVSVLVPVRDEISLIEGKLRNLLGLLEPPGGLDVWIVDGGSTDGTLEIIDRFCAADARLRLLRDVPGGKIVQLDAALACCDAPWVVVTDADARMPRHAIVEMLAVADEAPDVGAVGAPVEPHGAHALDRFHWQALNAARAAEARLGSAALVTGPCYLFRRDLLPRGFASGVIADDVHVAMTAAACGMRVAFAERVVVTELRSPSNLHELFSHKVRKADAYLREVVRFLPLLGRFPVPARTVFLWRAAQMVLFPVAAIGAIVSAAVMLASAGAATVGATVVAGAAVCGAEAVASAAAGRTPRLAPAAALALMLAAVLTAVLLTMPFARRSARYPKVGALAPLPEEARR